MNPVGLTRAEEERERDTTTRAARPQAPAGAARCVAALPPDGRACGAAAAYLVVWPDPEDRKTAACAECANRFLALAGSTGHGSRVSVESLP